MSAYIEAFYGCTSLKSVDLPKVTEVPHNAFTGTGLIEISLPEVVTIDNAFSDCKKLEKLDLPKLTVIKNNAFVGCDSLKNVSLPKVTEISSFAFAESGLVEIHLPELTTIATEYYNGGSFGGCTQLKTVDLPKLTNLPSYTFNGCDALTSVTLPSVTDVANAVCGEGSKLESIALPKAKSINRDSFFDCESLKSLDLSTSEVIEMAGGDYEYLVMPDELSKDVALTLNENKKPGGTSSPLVGEDGKWLDQTWKSINYVK